MSFLHTRENDEIQTTSAEYDKKFRATAKTICLRMISTQGSGGQRCATFQIALVLVLLYSSFCDVSTASIFSKDRKQIVVLIVDDFTEHG